MVTLTFMVTVFDRVNAAAPFAVRPGEGIGPVSLGMKISDFQKVLGGAPGANQGVVLFPQHGLSVFLRADRVVGVRTTNQSHRTLSGFGPGDRDLRAVRQALCNGGLREASGIHEMSKGFEVHCPLVGVVIEVLEGNVVSLTVIPAETISSRAR